MRQFQLSAVKNQPRLVSVTQSATSSGYPASSPVVSSSGQTAGTGIVWIINQNTTALEAYAAANVRTQLYNSNQNTSRDALASTIKFTVPLVANGRVYVGGDGAISAFGLPGN